MSATGQPAALVGLTMINVTIVSNYANGFGGGVAASFADVDIKGVRCANNSVNALHSLDLGDGGCASFHFCALRMDSVAMLHNYAQGSAGALHLEATGDLVAPGQLDHVRLQGNSATTCGGFLAHDSAVQANDITIFDGTAAVGGGGCLSESSMSITGLSMRSNHALGDGGGGGFHVASSTLRVVGNASYPVVMADLTAPAGSGGAVRASFGSNVLLSHFLVSNASALVSGGAVSTDSSTVTVEHGIVERCVAGGRGGGLDDVGSVVALSNMTWQHCSANKGGATVFSDAASSVVRDSAYLDNNAAAFGGAMYLRNGNVQVARTRFIGNAAEQGAGIHVEGVTHLKLTNTEFIDNVALPNNGGAVHADFESTVSVSPTVSYLGNVGGTVVMYDKCTLWVVCTCACLCLERGPAHIQCDAMKCDVRLW